MPFEFVAISLETVADDMASYIRDCGVEDIYVPEWKFQCVEDEDDAEILASDTPVVAQYECPDIECGATFLYLRVSCGHAVPPAFCPQCGGQFGETNLERDAILGSPIR